MTAVTSCQGLWMENSLSGIAGLETKLRLDSGCCYCWCFVVDGIVDVGVNVVVDVFVSP